MVLISLSLAFSQTLAYTARPLVHRLVYRLMLQLSLVITAPTHRGMARLSWSELARLHSSVYHSCDKIAMDFA